MIEITDEQLNFLAENVPNVKAIAAGGDIQALLDAIDDVIIDNMLGNKVRPQEPDELGIKLQKIWDQIYCQNT